MIDRAFKISDGLARLAGKKIKAAVKELEQEGIITKAEGSKAIGQMSKVKKNIYDAVSRELKKILVQSKKSKSKKKRS
jgi:hypothetical protein